MLAHSSEVPPDVFLLGVLLHVIVPIEVVEASAWFSRAVLYLESKWSTLCVLTSFDMRHGLGTGIAQNAPWLNRNKNEAVAIRVVSLSRACMLMASCTVVRFRLPCFWSLLHRRRCHFRVIRLAGLPTRLFGSRGRPAQWYKLIRLAGLVWRQLADEELAFPSPALFMSSALRSCLLRWHSVASGSEPRHRHEGRPGTQDFEDLAGLEPS